MLDQVYALQKFDLNIEKYLRVSPRGPNTTTHYFKFPTCFGGDEQFCAVCCPFVCTETLKNRSKTPLQVIREGY